MKGKCKVRYVGGTPLFPSCASALDNHNDSLRPRHLLLYSPEAALLCADIGAVPRGHPVDAWRAARPFQGLVLRHMRAAGIATRSPALAEGETTAQRFRQQALQ